jgi:hypothetical protein
MKNYKIIKWPNGTQWLDLEAKNLDECISFAKVNDIFNFICDFHPTDNINDLSFLRPAVVKGLNITFSGLKSNAELNQFNDLRILVSLFGKPVTLLDFSKLTTIEELEITYNSNVVGLPKLINLQALRLWQYIPKTKDLVEFKGYYKIKKIMLVQPAIRTLDGIENLNQLIELHIAKPKGFKYFFTNSKENCLSSLKELELSFCKELDFSTLPRLESLEELKITDSGKAIANLNFINSKFANLKTLIFTRTELLDGNLDYLLEHPTLEKVTIDHKKHYNMKEKEINALLAEKRNK